MASLLLADDETSFRQDLARWLEEAGHEVFQAGDGHRVLELYRSHKVHAVITAVLMPDRDGIEVIRDILGEGQATPVLAMSSGCTLCGLDVGRLALHMGARRVLEKPFTAETLLKGLDDLQLSDTASAALSGEAKHAA